MSTKTLTRTAGLPSVLDDFFKPWGDWFENPVPWKRMMTVPPVNITENKDEYMISLAVPGFQKKDFNIDVEGNMITVSLEKEDKKEEQEDDFTRKEFSYSSFSRSFTLPEEVNREKIEAVYEEGILKLSLPKKEEMKKAALSKHIAVQ